MGRRNPETAGRRRCAGGTRKPDRPRRARRPQRPAPLPAARSPAAVPTTTVRAGAPSIAGPERKVGGAECLAERRKRVGGAHVFHGPAGLRKTVAVMERRPDIKRLHVDGEKAAAYMADGYARASGKPGICAA